MSIWKVRDAKVRFRELLKAATEDGPQVITRHGAEFAVLDTNYR
jgi:prevent-host-death family protein